MTEYVLYVKKVMMMIKKMIITVVIIPIVIIFTKAILVDQSLTKKIQKAIMEWNTYTHTYPSSNIVVCLSNIEQKKHVLI